ncbi:gluconate 2-dehydrogenase subunit 3 family protein [bacterium]|nr:gluconate 2-dehydrogenase subunit 3 family protein [bacterium]
MNRREALSRIGLIAGGTLSASTLSGLLAGCSTPPAQDYVLQFLSKEQFDLIGSMANQIIPDTDTPGAVGAGVDRFIDNMLANYYPAAESHLFVSHLDAFALAYGQDVKDPTSLRNLVQRQDDAAFSAGHDEQDPAIQFYKKLKGLVVSGYYTSEVGMTTELNLKPYGDSRMDISVEDVGISWSN